MQMTCLFTAFQRLTGNVVVVVVEFIQLVILRPNSTGSM